jgi:hypothetical protein
MFNKVAVRRLGAVGAGGGSMQPDIVGIADEGESHDCLQIVPAPPDIKSVSFQVEPGVGVIEPMVFNEFFIGDRIELLHVFSEALFGLSKLI